MKKVKNKKPKKKKRGIGSPKSGKHRKVSYWLNVLPNDLWLEVPRGETILHALQKANIELEGDCGGLVKCGKCKVKVLTSIDLPSESEVHDLLDEEEINQGIRLACSTKIRKDLAVYVGEVDTQQEYFQILKAGETPIIQLDPIIEKQLIDLTPDSQNDGLSDLDRIRLELGHEYKELKASLHVLQTLPDMLKKTANYGAVVLHNKRMLGWQSYDETSRCYGLVFDLGTSTLVGKLISLLDGRQIAAISRLNRQIKYGTDVISRIQHIKEDPEGLSHMHESLMKDLNLIVKRLLEVGKLKPEDIFVAVAAGNTTMQHFLLSLDPSGIAEAPFPPVMTDGIIVNANDAGLMLNQEAVLYVMPTKSGYIGGDLISVILASEAAEQEDEMILGIDLGTNGEIFLGNRKRMMTCSAAAGPALEGAKITHGTIAKAGAIEGVRFIKGKLYYKEIGNIKPLGICGSGLVDLIAVLLNCGVIDNEGLIGPPAKGSECGLGSRVIEKGGVYNFLVASEEESHNGKPIYLTQKDVRELQLAKSAIAAGIQTLMDEMGIGLKDISRIYLAGALGNYINPYSAMNIGLLPMVDPGIVKSLGNAASTGATMVLLSKAYWKWSNELVHFIEHIELSCRKDFTEHFIANMDFPKDSPWERRSGEAESNAAGINML
jgi:uncharacterized 2Fe-2S/4Fe-4S cluster protein (DUF4445 family)